ncbi:MAG: FixG Ig-like domain-containing protein, partial [Brachymonas denitrificans]
LIAAALVTSLSMRKPMRVDIIRDRGVMSRIVDGGKIENVYLVRVMNTTESEQNYEIRVNGLPGATIAEGADMTIGPAQVEQHVVAVRIPVGSMEPGSHPIYLDIRETGSDAMVTEKAAFLVPK